MSLIFKYIMLVFPIVFLLSCKEKKQETLLPAHLFPTDTLCVVTMFSPTAYFVFQDEYMGYDYEMVENFAKYLHLPLKVVVAKNQEEMVALLESGKVDIAAFNTVQTKELKRNFTFVFPQPDSYQILVQRTDSTRLTSILQLNGQTVVVKQNSIFEERLIGLNKEIGGGIIVKYTSDSLSSEDLIELVALDSIDYTVAYYNTALLFQQIYRQLDLSLHVGFRQRNGWLVSNQSDSLKIEIEKWEKHKRTQQLVQRLRRKYWQQNYQLAYEEKLRLPRGKISPYDDWFKQYAPIAGWDWRLLAAVANAESGFKPDLTSWAGAIGIMQLMPATARKMGLEDSAFFLPEPNIKAGITYIKYLDRMFRNVENPDERVKFVLASYNIGPAHILDAMALAQKYGNNPHHWNEMEYYLIRKNEPEFYNDPVVKYGPMRGAVAVNFVNGILRKYREYSGK